MDSDYDEFNTHDDDGYDFNIIINHFHYYIFSCYHITTLEF